MAAFLAFGYFAYGFVVARSFAEANPAADWSHVARLNLLLAAAALALLVAALIRLFKRVRSSPARGPSN
jgi:hypothetical protein